MSWSVSVRRNAAAVVAAVSLVATVATAGAAGTASAGTASCAPYTAILVPGTWETNEGADPNVTVGMLKPIGDGLKAKYGNDVRVVMPAYPASAFDQGKTYGQSQAAGVAAVEQVLSSLCVGTHVLLGGYSQGAHIAGDVASSIGNGKGPIAPSQVVAVGLLSDPKRPKQGGAQLVGPPAPGAGIAGERPGGFGQLADVTREICDPTDLYCATDANRDGMLGALGHIIGNDQTPTTGAATTTGGTGGGTTTSTGTGLSAIPTTGAPSASSAAADATGTTSGSTSQTSSTGAGAQGAAASGLDGTGGADTARKELVSDFSQANLAGLGSAPSTLSDQIAALPATGTVATTGQATQLAGVGATATSLTNTLQPLQETVEFAKQNPSATKLLASAPAGSPQAAAAQVLDKASSVDLAQASSTATNLASTAQRLLGGTTSTAAAESAPAVLDDLTGAAGQLTTQLGPLTGLSGDTLASASTVLTTLKPSTLINQVLAVGSCLGELTRNLPKIGEDLAALPARIAALDVDGAHKLAGELNNLFSPIVKLAAQMDLHTAAKLVALIPDPTGYAQIASLVLNLLGNVDVIRLANDIGQAQETAWAALKNPVALGGLLPIGLDLASVAAGVLSGGPKTDPSQLGAMTQAAGQSAQLVSAAQNQNLPELGSTLLGLAGSQGAQDLTKLVGQGLDAASFYASGAHTSYGKFLVDGAQSAIDWLLRFFTDSIGTA